MAEPGLIIPLCINCKEVKLALVLAAALLTITVYVFIVVPS